MAKLFVDNMRRSRDVEKESVNLTLQKEIVDLAKKHGIESKRGGGNLSAAMELGLLLLIGIFDNPNIAQEVLIEFIEDGPAKDEAILDVADNLELIAKLLYDSKV